MKNSLLVFGTGNLGERVACLWKEKFPDVDVYAVTNTERNHSELRSKKILPFKSSEELPKASYVLFSIPPKDDYSELVEKAFKCWDESGNFLFISSASIYSESNSGIVNEGSILNPDHRLFPIEQFVISKSGSILRPVGLYDEYRGPHIYLNSKMKFNSSEMSLINLIHTQDAATLSMKALENGEKGACYLGCDGNPMTKKEFAKIVLGEKSSEVEYSNDPSTGKRCCNEWTRKVLNWGPKWSSFKVWAL